MSAEPSKPVAAPASALPNGTRLGEFEILKILGVGGFGIVYLAFDHALEREVAVKEYMPASLAGRTETLHVSLRSQSDADTFALGLRSFVNEAKLLARFDHPSLLKVHRFWEANGTAYMAMPVISGRTFKELRGEMTEPPDEAWLRRLLTPLLGAIQKLHGEDVYHRDIAPDNIVIEPDGRPVLLDFGAARRVINGKSQALTAILKPAYAPIEQYGEAGSVKQGPWTDLYALGATLHYMLLGRPPAPATARAMHDTQAPLSTLALTGVSTEFLNVVDWMLAPRPGDRPQSVAALRDVLEGRAAPPVRRVAEPEPPGDWERTQVLATQAPQDATLRFDALQPTIVQAGQGNLPAPAAGEPAPGLPKPRSKRLPAAAAALLVAGAGALFFWPRPAGVPAAEPVAPAPVAASAPAEAASAMAAAPSASTPAVARVAKADPAPNKPAPRPANTTAKAMGPANGLKPPETAEPPPAATAESPKPAVPHPLVVTTPEPASAAARLAGPTERCGKRVFVALWACIERECGKAELKQHPECVKWRSDQEKKTRPDAG